MDYIYLQFPWILVTYHIVPHTHTLDSPTLYLPLTLVQFTLLPRLQFSYLVVPLYLYIPYPHCLFTTFCGLLWVGSFWITVVHLYAHSWIPAFVGFLTFRLVDSWFSLDSRLWSCCGLLLVHALLPTFTGFCLHCCSWRLFCHWFLVIPAYLDWITFCCCCSLDWLILAPLPLHSWFTRTLRYLIATCDYQFWSPRIQFRWILFFHGRITYLCISVASWIPLDSPCLYLHLFIPHCFLAVRLHTWFTFITHALTPHYLQLGYTRSCSILLSRLYLPFPPHYTPSSIPSSLVWITVLLGLYTHIS